MAPHHLFGRLGADAVDRLIDRGLCPALTMTLAPSCANVCAIAKPIPAVLPVTRATLPVSWRSMSILLDASDAA
jgi:hypothetical protein